MPANNSGDPKPKRFRVAFSFAGEKRDFVEKVTRILANRFGEDGILYDNFCEAEFARARLGRYLPRLYHEESDLVVVIVCRDYPNKEWCGLEWDAIFDLLKKRREGEVMLANFERATIEGLYTDTGFIELDKKTPEQFVTRILERLALNEGLRKNYYTSPPVTDPQHWEKRSIDGDSFDHLSAATHWHSLSQQTIEDFLLQDRVQIQRDYLEGLTPIEQFRRFRFVVKNDEICNGAYLCFAHSPSDRILGATTKCFHWKGINRASGFSADLEARDSLLQQFKATITFLKRELRLERQITDEGRKEILEIPLDVLEEVVANALVHRDYNARHESVTVSLFEDRIEVISPGRLPPPLAIAMIGDAAISHPRNPQIARIFYLCGYVERAGSGIERMKSSLAARGLPPPIFEETPDDCFKVILKRPDAAVAKTREGRPARTSIPHNLPSLQPFFGREEELRKISDALNLESRTWGALIDGPGGMGKTSLAVRAAYDVRADAFDRIVFVSLKSRELDDDGVRDLSAFLVSGLAELLNELAKELGHADVAKAVETERPRLLLDALRGTRTLLVLDHLESLLKRERDSVFTFVKKLPPGCKAILTSRGRIGSGAEELILEKLSEDAAMATLAKLAETNPALAKTSEAERLTLYRETGGKPLLLRWAAGQIGRGSCVTFTDAIAYLRSCPEGNDPLEFIFGDLVEDFSESETRTLCALTYFTLPAKVAQIAIISQRDEAETERALKSLINRSLVVPSEQSKAFTLVPLVTDFLRLKKPEVLRETGDRLEKHAYALVVENGYENHDRFPVLDAAWPTAAAALPRFLAGENARLQTVCDALANFLNFTGRWDEWLALSRNAEGRAAAARDFESAGWRAHQTGWVHYLRGQSVEVLSCADRAESHWREAKAGAREQATALRLRGLGHDLAKDYAAAIAAYRKAVELHRSLGRESVDVATTLNALATTEKDSGDIDAAESDYREALRIARTVDYAEGVASITGHLATLALNRKDWSGAETLAREALALSEKLGRLELIGRDYRRLAQALVRQGKKKKAFPYAQRAVEIYQKLGSPDLAPAQQTLAECESSEVDSD